MIFSQSSAMCAINPTAVRPALARRLSRVRIAWFILGITAGCLLCYGLFALLNRDVQLSKRLSLSHALVLLESTFKSPPPPVQMISAITAASHAALFAANVPPAKPEVVAGTYTLTVHRGDTLASLLITKGVASDEARTIESSIKPLYNPRNLIAGQSVQVYLDKSPDDRTKPIVTSLSLAPSILRTVELARDSNNGFSAKEIKTPITKSLARAGGEIRSSLYQTGVDSGLPPQMLAEIIQAFSYDVDFQRDIHEGDGLDVVFERMHTDKNVTTGYGKVIYASLTLGDEQYTVYRHLSPDGFAGYYNGKGESVKKALLKTPINGAHITSGFGMRMHPLLGYSKMHKGIDFGALTGTPIYAAGDGVIEEAGRKGGYGNYVKIKHSSNYATAYGHANSIARGIHPGVHVKQGQVIAYVGSTGFSTGPHLHYEILVGGAQVNPSGVKFRTGQTLGGHELAQFKREVQQVQTALSTLPHKMQVASLEQ